MREDQGCALRTGEMEREKTRRVRLKPINRQQMMLRPIEVDRLVPEDHEVWAIWEFVGRLDLSRYYEAIEVVEGEAGRQVAEMGDPRTTEEVSPRVAKARQRAVQEKRERLEKALEELEKVRTLKSSQEEKKEARVSLSDPEARVMKQSDGGYAPSYNVQISTDAKEKVIVGIGVSQSGSDYEELVPAVDGLSELSLPAEVLSPKWTAIDCARGGCP